MVHVYDVMCNVFRQLAPLKGAFSDHYLAVTFLLEYLIFVVVPIAWEPDFCQLDFYLMSESCSDRYPAITALYLKWAGFDRRSALEAIL